MKLEDAIRFLCQAASDPCPARVPRDRGGRRFGSRTLCRVLFAAMLLILFAPHPAAGAAARWWKGNLHTHSFWSDGDDFPEMVAAWYKDHGYHFLAISDHNVMLEGEKWLPLGRKRGAAIALDKYLVRFGADWVEVRGEGTNRAVRLKTLAEFRGKLEHPGRFLLITGEEITDHFEQLPVHVNATHLRELIPPQGGNSVYEVMQNNVDAVLAQRARTGQPMIPHLNHPNFGWALTAEDMMRVRGERFFEVYNGHPAVANRGDDLHASTERIWDIILTRRLTELGLEPMWATAVDDAHDYHEFKPTEANPGRGWIMVRARALTPEALIAAMEAGDFYASTGVRLKDVQRKRNELRIKIDAEKGVTYTTQFIGTRRGYDARHEPVRDSNGRALRATRRYSSELGAVLAEVRGTTAIYRLKGDEIYVRAKVISSKPKTNPTYPGEVEVAWVQPLVPSR